MNFRSLDLTDALTTGWQDISMSEFRILNWIATRGGGRGKRAGYPFTWTLKHGADDWAMLLAMPRRTLFHGLKKLAEKGLVVSLPGSVPTYGIPTNVLLSAVAWNAERKDMVSYIQECRVQELALEQVVGVQEVALPSAKNGTQTPPLTCGNAVQETKKEDIERKKLPLKRGVDSVAAPETSPKETPVSDGWDQPRDDTDTFSVSREDRSKPKRAPALSTQLADSFRSQWLTAREKRTMLALPWSSKAAFQANLKRMLTEHTAPEIETMIEVFFRQVTAGSITLRSDELWKDFWNNRAELYRLTQRTTRTDDLTEIEALNARHRARGHSALTETS